MELTTITNAVNLQLSGKGTTDRKMSALSQADSYGIRAIAHGSGKVAKEAQAALREEDLFAIAENIGKGNLHAFAVAFAARTGEAVKFGIKDEDGKWAVKPTEDFVRFGAVLAHRMTQLEDKDKVFSASGKYTAAATDLLYLIGLHKMACRVIEEIRRADDERRARLAEERKTLEALENLMANEAQLATEQAAA